MWDFPDLLLQAHLVIIFRLKTLWIPLVITAIPAKTNAKLAISSKSLCFPMQNPGIRRKSIEIQRKSMEIQSKSIEIQRYQLEIHPQIIFHKGLWAGSIILWSFREALVKLLAVNWTRDRDRQRNPRKSQIQLESKEIIRKQWKSIENNVFRGYPKVVN